MPRNRKQDTDRRRGTVRVASVPVLICAIIVGAAGAAPLPPASERKVVYPTGVGALNVREAPYNARGDGETDDTAAIQKALTDGLDKHRVVYLPAGTYLVSDTLRWRNPARAGDSADGWGRFLMLQGQSRTRTVIRLRNACPGFTDSAVPKAVAQTGSSAGHGDKRYKNGEGNEAFENHIRDLTIDTGRGNAGAVGVAYQASNTAAMRRVTVRSGDGNGVCGIDLTRRDNGPGLLKNVAVDGFRVGVRASGQEVCVFVIEDMQLSGQTEAGIVNTGSVLALRRVVSRGRVSALKVSGGSLTHLLDSRLSGDPTGKGGASSEPSVVLIGPDARLHVRNLKTWRFATAIRDRDKDVKAETVAEWVSDTPPEGLAKGDLKLPVQETPEYWEPDATRWADPGAPTGTDDTNALQAALDSGRAAVCLRYGMYRTRRTLRVPPTVRLIFGVGASIDPTPELGPGESLFRITGGAAGTPPVILDRLATNAEGRFLIEHDAPRAVVLADILAFGGNVYRNREGAGPLFLEDVAGAGYRFDHPTQVWARNWDFEGKGEPKVFNNGGTMWGLGFKHEGGETVAENRGGGRMELLGGLAYTFGTEPNKPAFAIERGSALSLSLLGVSFVGGERPFFPILVRTVGADGKPSGVEVPSGATGGGTLMRLIRGTSAPVPLSTTLTGHDVSGKPITVTVALPDAEAGRYRGTRFAHVPMVTAAQWNGHAFWGEWNPARGDAFGHDSNAIGTAEEFDIDGPASYTTAPPGAEFLKIGVGLLRKPVGMETPYHFYDRYEVTRPARLVATRRGEGFVETEQAVRSDDKRLGYRYTYRVALVPGQATLRITRTLANIGSEPLSTEHYCHNFTRIDDDLAGPSYRVELAFTPTSEDAANAGKQGLTLGKEGIGFSRILPDGAAAFARLTGFPPKTGTAGDFTVGNQRTGGQIGVKHPSRSGESSLTRFNLYAAPGAVCPEPFWRITIAPGASHSWQTTYTFSREKK